MNWSETRPLRTLRCCKSIGAVPHPACADCCYESAAPSRLIPFKFDCEFVTRGGVIRVQEIRLGNGLPYRQCYKSCCCYEHLCHYMAAPPPRSHRGAGYGRRCRARPLRRRMLFGCRIPVARRCSASGIWVDNYGCEMGQRELDAATQRLRRRQHHLCLGGAARLFARRF